ncbi:MAG: hypothetical protein M3Y65_16665 [Pseudomonadota bacterium]|nr:hypothetical protein [Pseudomonadota bacterium]
MHKLILELIRLYLAPDTAPDRLAPRISGHDSSAIDLADADGNVRAIHLPFRKIRNGDEAQHWTLLCEVANALQTGMDFPAPAVSVSGSDGYGLWLSLVTPIPAALAQEFVALLKLAYFPDVKMAVEPPTTQVLLPPCVHPQTGKWAAFIHPGMGASFADDSGLEMAPPLSGQVGFLESLQSIDDDQFAQALALLRSKHGGAVAPLLAVSAAAPVTAPAGLLLRDATVEDIVAFLHAKNIEPTLRYLIKP